MMKLYFGVRLAPHVGLLLSWFLSFYTLSFGIFLFWALRHFSLRICPFISSGFSFCGCSNTRRGLKLKSDSSTLTSYKSNLSLFFLPPAPVQFIYLLFSYIFPFLALILLSTLKYKNGHLPTSFRQRRSQFNPQKCFLIYVM